MLTKKQIKEEIDACIDNVRKELARPVRKDWDRDWKKIHDNVEMIIEFQSVYYLRREECQNAQNVKKK